MQTESFRSVSGKLFEPRCGIGHRLFRRGEIGERVDVGELFGGRFAIGNDACEGDARKLRGVTKCGDLSDALAHECLAVDRAFGSDDEIGVVKASFQMCLPREEVEARGELRADKRTEAEAEATSSARARDVREIQRMLLFECAREVLQTTFGQRKIFGPQPLLRTVNTGATFRAEQRILHVNSDNDLRESQG